MKTIGLKVRQRMLDSYDQGGRTREEMAKWFGVSLGMVEKLLQQRRKIKEWLRAAKARTQEALESAIAQALKAITPEDAASVVSHK